MYPRLQNHFQDKFAEYQGQSLSSEDISSFLDKHTEGLSKSTRHLRYAQIKAFFNYIIDIAGRNGIPIEFIYFKNYPQTSGPEDNPDILGED